MKIIGIRIVDFPWLEPFFGAVRPVVSRHFFWPNFLRIFVIEFGALSAAVFGNNSELPAWKKVDLCKESLGFINGEQDPESLGSDSSQANEIVSNFISAAKDLPIKILSEMVTRGKKTDALVYFDAAIALEYSEAPRVKKAVHMLKVYGEDVKPLRSGHIAWMLHEATLRLIRIKAYLAQQARRWPNNLLELDPPPTSFRVSADGSHVVYRIGTDGGPVYIASTENGKILSRLENPPIVERDRHIGAYTDAFKFSQDGKTLYGSHDLFLHRWDVSSGKWMGTSKVNSNDFKISLILPHENGEGGMVMLWEEYELDHQPRRALIQRYRRMNEDEARARVEEAKSKAEGAEWPGSESLEDASVANLEILETVEIRGKGKITSAAVSPHGQWMAIGTSEGHVEIRYMDSLKLIGAHDTKPHLPAPKIIMQTPEGMAIESELSLHQYEAAISYLFSHGLIGKEVADQLRQQKEGKDLEKHSIKNIFFNADGTEVHAVKALQLITFPLQNRGIKEKEIYELPGMNEILTAAISSNRRYIVIGTREAGTDREIGVFDLEMKNFEAKKLLPNAPEYQTTRHIPDIKYLEGIRHISITEDGMVYISSLRDHVLVRVPLSEIQPKGTGNESLP